MTDPNNSFFNFVKGNLLNKGKHQMKYNDIPFRCIYDALIKTMEYGEKRNCVVVCMAGHG